MISAIRRPELFLAEGRFEEFCDNGLALADHVLVDTRTGLDFRYRLELASRETSALR
jgi:hypothetical protein